MSEQSCGTCGRCTTVDDSEIMGVCGPMDAHVSLRLSGKRCAFWRTNGRTERVAVPFKYVDGMPVQCEEADVVVWLEGDLPVRVVERVDGEVGGG